LHILEILLRVLLLPLGFFLLLPLEVLLVELAELPPLALLGSLLFELLLGLALGFRLSHGGVR
jgi:hypothetical protein